MHVLYIIIGIKFLQLHNNNNNITIHVPTTGYKLDFNLDVSDIVNTDTGFSLHFIINRDVFQ